MKQGKPKCFSKLIDITNNFLSKIDENLALFTDQIFEFIFHIYKNVYFDN